MQENAGNLNKTIHVCYKLLKIGSYFSITLCMYIYRYVCVYMTDSTVLNLVISVEAECGQMDVNVMTVLRS